MKDLSDRLQVLEDREAIRDVLHAYARAVDRGDAALMKSCYHEDAWDDHGFYAGPAHAFADYVLPQLARLDASVHSLTNPIIRLDGDAAEVETQWSVVHRLSGARSLTDLWHQGRYLDRFERRDGAWRIARREAVLDMERWLRTADLRRLTSLDVAVRRLIGRRGTEDPSYAKRDGAGPHDGPADLWRPVRQALWLPVWLLHRLARR